MIFDSSASTLFTTPFAVGSHKQSESRSILFVDRSVNNYQSLLESQPGLEIQILDSNQNAISQITQTLSGRSGIESIQILSHGTSGGLFLGAEFLNATELDRQSQQIQSWKQALTDDADILLYGCNVGSGTLGQAFIQSLSQLTGADVAASDDITGQNSDWNLETNTGTIEAKIALNAIGMANYQSSLNSPLWARSTGGSGGSDNDTGNAITVDSAGNTYITGKLQGSNIPFDNATISTKDGSPDAFVTKLDASGNFLWTKTFAGSSPVVPALALDVGQGIAVDSQGNVFVIGSFQGTMNLGSSSLTSYGILDVFVLKLNGSNGNLTWGKNFGGNGIEQGFAIGLDGDNNAYITGTFGDISRSVDATFGSKTIQKSGNTDAFIAKLDGGDGNVLWAKSYGGNANDTGFGIAATSGGVYVTGNTETAGNYDIFAVKLDSSNGNILWDKKFGGAGEDTSKAITVDASGNAYLTGYLKSSTTTFGTVTVQSSGTDVFAVKLNNSDGSVAWAKSLGSSGDEYGNGIALDGNGNLYIAGSFTSSTWNLGTTTLTKNDVGSADIFALKINSADGSLTWAKSFGGSSFESAYGIAVDGVGNSYLTGEFFSPALTFGNTTLNGRGGFDFFVTKLDNIDPIDRKATGTLSTTGTPQEGGTLTGNLTNVVDADGATTTAYRWQEFVNNVWVNLSGQTNAILNIASDQSMVGKQVRVIATTTDTQGGTTEFTGAAQTIANIDDPATGNLVVTGTAIVGGSLSASLTNVVDPDGTPSIAYRWQELSNGNWIDVSGQTSAMFNITNNTSNVGKQVRVIATTTDPFNGTTEFTSTAQTIAGIVVVDRPATGTLSTTGTPEEGGTLTANLTNVVDADGTTTTAYRWQEFVNNVWVNISGQTNATLNIASDQSMVGKQLRVVATTTDIKGGTTEFIGTAQSIANVDDPATGSLTINGTAQQGNTISGQFLNLVDLDGTPTIAYRWQEFSNNVWVNIAGETAQTLNLSNAALVGKIVRITATTTDPFGGTTNFTSTQTTISAAVIVVDQEATGTLSTTGTPEEGGTLTANLTNVVDADGTTTTAYRWQEFVNNVWVNISGQTNAVLNIASDQSMVGKQLRVVATTTDIKGGTTEFIGTAQSIANVDDPATGSLTINGTAQQGNTISATLANLIEPDGTPTIAYRWQERSGTTWVDITGATAENFVLTNAALVGKTIRAIATTTDPFGGTTSFISTEATVIAAIVTGDREATGTLSVTGTAEEGGTLTANLTNVVDADGTTTTAYRWQILNGATWTDISGNNTASFNIASDQSMVGKKIRVIATTTDTQSGTTEFVGNTQTIANVDDAATGVISVERLGGVLTASLTAEDLDGEISKAYRWQEFKNGAWSNITGATNATFTIPNDLTTIGQQVRVIGTTTDVLGGTTVFTSSATTIDSQTEPLNRSPLDLVFYDPSRGQVSFAFVGAGYDIANEALTSNTPALTNNANNGTPLFGDGWRMVSASVDVDRDGKQDIIVANKFDNSVVVFFGEAHTRSSRNFAYTRSGYVTNAAGQVYRPGADWTLDFASNKIGMNDSPGLFWRSKDGVLAVWSMTQPVTTTNGTTNIVISSSGAIFNAGANSGWRAVGDGEFNANTATREVFFVNDINSKVVTWSLNGARALSSGKLAWSGLVNTSNYRVVGISNVSGSDLNDNIIWQTGSTVIVWNMVNGEYSATGSAAITLTSTDRIKSLADVDGDGVLDLVGQGSDGTIAAYSLTSAFALKNTAAPRTQYTSNNTSYRPAKGDPNAANLELVNVAQYGV